MVLSHLNDAVIQKVPAWSLEAEERLLTLHPLDCPPIVPILSPRTSIPGDAERNFVSRAQALQTILHGTGRISSVPGG